MLRPEYYHEYNGGLYQDLMMQQAFQQNVPSLGRVFEESISFAFNDNTFIHGADYLETINEENAQNALTEEEYNHSQYSRKQLGWHEGITEVQAKVLSERYDRETFYAQYTGNVGAFNAARIGGLIIGGIPDPINYIPYVGILSKVSRVARLLHKMPVLGMAANSMISQTAFETAKYTAIAQMGGDINYRAAVMDVAIAGLIGSGAGLLFGGLGAKSGLQKRIGQSEFSNDLVVAGVFNGDRIPVSNRGQALITSVDDPINTLTSPTTKPEPPIIRNEEIINHEQIINNKIDETIKVAPTDKVNIVKQTVEAISNVIRKAKSCTLGLFG